MAVKNVPISGSVLGWAREEAGFTRLDLAERAKLPVENISRLGSPGQTAYQS